MNKKKLIELRCKAWGITEDEYYCNQCSDFSLEDMARAYRRGKNKGARDKAIQNVGFYQKQMQDIYDKKNKQIADLKTQIEKMKCCDNCVHFDFTEPNYCHKGVYRANQKVCGEWCFGN